MQVQVNGDMRELDDGATVAALLALLALGERRVAVEVNGDIVPRSKHAQHVLCAGDRVEIVHAIGGG